MALAEVDPEIFELSGSCARELSHAARSGLLIRPCRKRPQYRGTAAIYRTPAPSSLTAAGLSLGRILEAVAHDRSLGGTRR
jgi:hypothetical protein